MCVWAGAAAVGNFIGGQSLRSSLDSLSFLPMGVILVQITLDNPANAFGGETTPGEARGRCAAYRCRGASRFPVARFSAPGMGD